MTFLRGSVIKTRQVKGVGLAYLFERARNDVDDNVTMSLVHPFLPEDVDDDLRAMIESNT